MTIDSRWFGALCAALATGTAALAAQADEPALEASLRCETGRAPGRVRCALEVAAPPGRRMDWADALVLETPAFARALRSRVGMREVDAVRGAVTLPLALVLEGPGRGLVRVRARAVVCQSSAGRERCFPATREVQVELVAER